MTTYLGTATGTTHGIEGRTASPATANGIKALSTSGYAALYATSSGGGALYADCSGTDITSYAVMGVHVNGGKGVVGTETSGAASGFGVFGSGYYGLYAESAGSGGRGVYGYVSANNSGAYGVLGHAQFGSVAKAGYFAGQVIVSGDFQVTGTKAFEIDHPLDPANKLLLHACIESPERKQLYDGIGTADAAGELVVQLPVYFEALNADIRYQLTPIAGSAPSLHVKDEVRNGMFVIGGAAPGQRVCWQVTGVRNDPSARMNPFTSERDKPDDERGFYLCPEAYGQPKEMHVDVKRLGTRPPALDLDLSKAP
jgi:hypothetical protein